MWYLGCRDCRYLTPDSMTIIDQTKIWERTSVTGFSELIHCVDCHTLSFSSPRKDRKTQQRKRLPSLHLSCVHMFLLCRCGHGGRRRGTLGPHLWSLADQKWFLLLHHTKLIRKGFIIYSSIFSSFFHPAITKKVHRLSRKGSMLVKMRRHTVINKR